MIVLSLFDGCSCGMEALKRADIPVEKYYASEIDKYATIVSEKNHPEIIRLGDIEKWIEWDIDQPDIIIAGSPCQGFSFAGKRLNFDDPRSRLFFTFVDILKHYKPEYFLLENVKMGKSENDVISRMLHEIYPDGQYQGELFQGPRLEPVLINSSLVSAQNRERLYWCNWNVEQPKNKGILLKDIIESGEVEKGITDKTLKYIIDKKGAPDNNMNRKARCFTAGAHSGGTHSDMDLIPVIMQKPRGHNKGGIKGEDGKSPALTSNSWEHNNHVVCGAIRGRPIDNPKSRQSGLPTKQMLEIREDEKTNCLTSVQKDNVVCINKNYIQYDNSGKGHNSQTARIYKKSGKHGCLTHSNTNVNVYQSENEEYIYYRKLTPIECERLQTLPDNYTEGVSNTQRYKMIGNGWTVDVIAHIFSFLKGDPK
jgi:DNA (cytosine-5)-methyltransferase 3A